MQLGSVLVMQTLALPDAVEQQSLKTLQEKLKPPLVFASRTTGRNQFLTNANFGRSRDRYSKPRQVLEKVSG